MSSANRELEIFGKPYSTFLVATYLVHFLFRIKIDSLLLHKDENSIFFFACDSVKHKVLYLREVFPSPLFPLVPPEVSIEEYAFLGVRASFLAFSFL